MLHERIVTAAQVVPCPNDATQAAVPLILTGDEGVKLGVNSTTRIGLEEDEALARLQVVVVPRRPALSGD